MDETIRVDKTQLMFLMNLAVEASLPFVIMARSGSMSPDEADRELVKARMGVIESVWESYRN